MTWRLQVVLSLSAIVFLIVPAFARADALTLTSGNSATTTPNVATSITGFQIVGNAASTTPVKIFVTNGTVSVSTTSGLTATGNGTATLNLSGTVANLNAALSTLTYTRSSTGTDTLEVALVNSNQIYFPTNGHVYQYVGTSLTWTAAKAAAEALTAYGASGYLVTITSSAENNFVKARLSGDAWIGASDSGVEGVWKWVTGPEAGTQFWQGAGGGSTVNGQYASWNGGEPNDSGGNEDCGEEYVADGTWNDLPCTGTTVSGYVAEFGSDSDPVTVVSKNVSIVTADVPAVTTLSPATGVTNASPSANLVIGFSKTVTKDTGNILIKKTSDDSIVETIAVSGSQVTGSGSTSLTINPNTVLDEGTAYYVIIPSTAFKDSSNNYFAGISDSTTWTFTTSDATPPVISALASGSVATTTAAITWTTNEGASSKVVYSVGDLFNSATSETDTSPRVTSHTKTLSGLMACTSYNYKVVSADAAGNRATSTQALFTTLGCAGSQTPSSATTTPITVASASTATLTDTERTLSVTTPANFTATTTSVVIQIKAQEATPVLDSLGKPANLLSAASVVFDVTALIDNTTVLDSFDSPVTISYTYTDEDIAGLEETTLSMYHYHDDAWTKLSNCSVDTAANTITCDTPSFSTFAIFGNLIATGGNHSSSIPNRVANLLSMGKVAEAEALKVEWRHIFPVAQTATSTSLLVRDLTLGSTGEDVRLLQTFLNTHGFPLAASGVGSSGNETTTFGSLTRAALAKFQAANNVAPSVGYFGSLTRTKIHSLGLSGTWW